MTKFVRLEVVGPGAIYVNPAAVAKIMPSGEDGYSLMVFGDGVKLEIAKGTPAQVAGQLTREASWARK